MVLNVFNFNLFPSLYLVPQVFQELTLRLLHGLRCHSPHSHPKIRGWVLVGTVYILKALAFPFCVLSLTSMVVVSLVVWVRIVLVERAYTGQLSHWRVLVGDHSHLHSLVWMPLVIGKRPLECHCLLVLHLHLRIHHLLLLVVLVTLRSVVRVLLPHLSRPNILT